MSDFNKPCYRRTRNRAFACSDELWDQIKQETNEIITVSAFVRRAVKKELMECQNARRRE